MWNTHFPVHEDETASVKPCSVTSSCAYCGDQVPYNGQTHIAKYHLLQTFVLKLCQVGKYFYRSLDGVPVSDLTNIVYPGSKRNLLNFSWVRCKRCAVSAIGLDKKTIGHQEFSHSGGGLEYFMIYCR